MGSSSQTTNQSSSTSPWAAAQPEVQGLLNNVLTQQGNIGVTPAEQGAIGQLTANGQAGNPYAGGTSAAVNNLLTGGGATGQIPALQQNLSNFQTGLSPYTAANYSTLNSPAVQAALQQVQSDVTNQVNGQFAAGGRYGSPDNSQALARGIAQGEAPIILNQANTDTANRQAALSALYGGGNTTAGAISGLTQQGVNNQTTGIGNVGTALNNSNWGPQSIIQAQELQKQIPASNLGFLAQIGIPLAQLGQNSTGQSTTTQNPSLLSQIGQIGQLFSAPGQGGTSAAAGLGQAASGLASGASSGLSSLASILGL